LQQTYKGVTRFVQQGNPDLKWEEVATTGVGVDFTSKNRRLSVTLDYYNNKRTNMLYFAPTPGGFAPTSYWWINLDGEVTNKGLELGLSYKAIQGEKFKWDINFNLTTVENNIEGLPVSINTGEVSGQGLTGSFAQVLKSGSPIFSWYMPEFLGYDGNGIAHSGDSMVVDPLGEIIYTNNQQEDIYTLLLNKNTLADVRSKFPFWKDADEFNISIDNG
jgi:iron complex outermembrane receptor protein